MSEVWRILAFLSIIAFALMIWRYFRFLQEQTNQVITLAEVYALLPRRWLAFVFFPWIGKKIFTSIYEKFGLAPVYLKLSAMRSGEINPSPIPIGVSNWFLFEEQYDRKTSAHHGTKITLLDKNRSYRFLTSSLFDQPADMGVIYIETPRQLPLVPDQLFIENEMLWANLHCGDHTSSWWILENLFIGTVIPVVHTRKGKKKGKMIVGGNSDRLESQDKFCIGLSEFQIICLPSLVISCSRVEYLDEKYAGREIHNGPVPIDGEVSFGSGQNNYFRAYSEYIPRTHWKITNGVLTILSEGPLLEYISIIDGLPVDCKLGEQILLMPGDKFRIARGSDLEYRFKIDYSREL